MPLTPTLETIPVALGADSYDILLGRGLLRDAAAQTSAFWRIDTKVILLTDAHVDTLYSNTIQLSFLDAGAVIHKIVVEQGETSKSFAVYERVLEEILSLPIDRKTLLIALGGGVVGDLGGFIAATALRGIVFIQIPTTLLAMADSSVGGKTAINTKAGKNLVGAFYQPRRVLIDLDVIETLPLRARREGYAEILKYGLLGDANFYEWCLANGASVLAGEAGALHYAVAKSCTAKAAIVSKDEREAGIRAHLNLGHTFAHALEAATGYSHKLHHGEAVAFGLRLATQLSVLLKYIPEAEKTRLNYHLNTLGFAPTLNMLVPGHVFDPAMLLALMEADKKTVGGKKVFILLRSIGEAFEDKAVDDAAVLAVLQESMQ